MKVWAIADLHLAFGVPSKTMEVFGPRWKNYAQRIEKNWREAIEPEDLVLIAGDISWALKLEEAQIDLNWIEHLPGTKVLIKGNHDYWWSSLSRVRKILPPSLHPIQNNAFRYQEISIGGTRLWDTEEYHFEAFVEKKPSSSGKKEDNSGAKKIFERELIRLEASLKELDQKANCRIVMTHYPPVGANLAPTQTTALLEKYNVDICVFGHLHNIHQGALPFGKLGKTAYLLTSSDYLNFSPLLIYSA